MYEAILILKIDALAVLNEQTFPRCVLFFYIILTQKNLLKCYIKEAVVL